MDPQKLSQLDPKLRDAYQRVMGTAIPEPQAAPVQSQTPPPPTPAPTPEEAPNPAAVPISKPEPTPPPADGPTIEEPPTQPIESPVQPSTAEPHFTPTPELSMPEPSVSKPQPLTTQPEPVSEPQPPVPASNFVQMYSEVAAAPTSANFSAPAHMPQAQTMPQKKKSSFMPILAGIVILIFIVVYALFWTKIFNFKLPFFPF